jgi:hypothetical protein
MKFKIEHETNDEEEYEMIMTIIKLYSQNSKEDFKELEDG